MKSLTIFGLTIVAIAALMGASAAHSQPASSLPPNSHYEQRNGQWELVPDASSNADRGYHDRDRDPGREQADNCSNPEPRGLQNYPIWINGCKVWCHPGLAAGVINAPGCDDPQNHQNVRRDEDESDHGRDQQRGPDYAYGPPPVVVATPVFCPSYRTYSLFGTYTAGCPGYGGYPYGPVVGFGIGFGHGWHGGYGRRRWR